MRSRRLPRRRRPAPATAQSQQAQHAKLEPWDVEAVWRALAGGRARKVMVLAERALPLLDELEQRLGQADDARALELAYAVDSLVAQIRRNAYGQNVLADGHEEELGGQTSTLRDVINAAASGIENYRRLRLATIADFAVIGSAADDVAVLLGELLDNAAQWGTQVVASAYMADSGTAVIRIEDNGPRVAHLHVINKALAGPVPDLGARMAARSGFAIVHRIARSYGIAVQLIDRDLTEPGTIAIVTIPAMLLCDPIAAVATGRSHAAETGSFSPTPQHTGGPKAPPTEHSGLLPPALGQGVTAQGDASEPARTASGLPRRNRHVHVPHDPFPAAPTEDPAAGAAAFSAGLAGIDDHDSSGDHEQRQE